MKQKYIKTLQDNFKEACLHILESNLETWALWVTLDMEVMACTNEVSPEIVQRAYPGALYIGSYNREASLWGMWLDIRKTLKESAACTNIA